jgi:putative ABC transport system permease protein
MEWQDVRRALFPKRMIGPDVHEEIDFHLRERVRELVRRGWSEERARAFVLERFGNVDSVEAACRAYDEERVDGERRSRMLEAWSRDVRLAARSLRRSSGFTAVVVMTLALGVGASTAVFSVVESVLLRPLPFPDPQELAVVWQNDRATGTVRENASTADYWDYVERSRTFTDLAMYGLGPNILARDGAEPLLVNTAVATPNLQAVLGFDMQLGRMFTEAESAPGGAYVAVLSDRLWRDAFGADRSILGRAISIDDVSVTVLGVLPADLDFPERQTDLWAPIHETPATAIRSSHWVRVIGRMRDGTTVEAAQAEMTRIMADLETEFASDNRNRGAFVERLADVGRGDLRRTLWVLFAAVLAVLAIACVNVANLLLARGAGRHREVAVLVAVGAEARQVTRRFFAEGVIITVLAAAGGVALAALGVRALTSLAPQALVALGEPEINAPVLGFALAVSVLICLGFGLLPTLQAGRLDLQRELKEGRTTYGGSARLTVRRMLVAGQLSLAVVLLVGSTLLIGTLRNLESVDPGFRPERTLRADFALPLTRYPRDDASYPDWPVIHGFLRSLEAEVEAIPGVRSAAVTLNHPLDGGFTNSFRIEGRAYDPSQGEMATRLITPGYFETAGLRVLKGRPLEESDQVGTTQVLLLNREAATRLFPEGDAIGQRIAFWGPVYREVVGIVENERIHGPRADAPPAMYVTMYQSPPRAGEITLMLRSDVASTTLAEAVREAMRRVDPGIPVFDVATMEETLADAVSRERFASLVLTVFGGVAILLAIFGVHGVLAYVVAQRGHEVGVRMALGATRGDVVRLVVGQGASMTVLGILLGLVSAVAVSGLLRGLLYGVSPTDARVYAGAAGGLALVALAATAIPAWRAARVDPVASLRAE